jgi:uncharacterized protein YecT (DUF1311 family)
MKKSLFYLAFALNCAIVFGQAPRAITRQDSIRIAKEADDCALVLRKQLEKKYSDDSQKSLMIDFAVDTCRIERIASKKMEIDYSTLGMSMAVDELNSQYDKLLNKYYQKLSARLNGQDKEVLKQTQRNWIQFRESEIKLINLLSEEKYSGGGTIQMNIRSANSLDLTKKRLIDLYQHLLGFID